MKTENHILDILQLHEYGMAIGQSLEYKKSCDLFLTLLLKRKNLNAAWIIEKRSDQFVTTYAIPLGNKKETKMPSQDSAFFNDIEDHIVLDTYAHLQKLAPIDLENGRLAIFSLKEQGFLFLYSKKENIIPRDLSQIQPVINKFGIHLKACKAFKEQENLLKDLEIQNQELNDYAHMVSHDLKSPLRSIEALLSWLKEDYRDALGEKGAQEIDHIGSHLEKMDALITGILHYSSIDRDLRKQRPVQLNSITDDIISLLKPAQHITIAVKELPTIIADQFKIQQLFQNLIGNAIANMDKPEGRIEIAYEKNAKEGHFVVSDNGKGINPAYFDKIFEIFQKLETDSKSTGIGLSIVKKVVHFYGGTIWLESEEGIGSRFYFTLPQTFTDGKT